MVGKVDPTAGDAVCLKGDFSPITVITIARKFKLILSFNSHLAAAISAETNLTERHGLVE